MMPTASVTVQPPQRRWLLATVGVLVLVLLAVGYVQWRQYKLLDTATHFQNDGLGWSFSYVGGSALLSDHLELHERTRVQGVADAMIWSAAAAASLGSGLIVAAAGYAALGVLGLGLVAVAVVVVTRNRNAALTARV